MNYYKLYKEKNKPWIVIEEMWDARHRLGTRLKITNWCEYVTTRWKKIPFAPSIPYPRFEGMIQTRYKRTKDLDKYLKNFIDRKEYQVVSNVHPSILTENIFSEFDKLIETFKN